MSIPMIAQRYVGQPVRRTEDHRILTGGGAFVDDLARPGTAHAAFLRSPVAHARVVSVDVSAARELPGVLAVYTGAEMEALIVPGSYGPGVEYGQIGVPEHSLLATDKVRLVGDLVAMVVAENRYLAEDALQLIEVEYDELEPITTAKRAIAADAPLIFEAFGSNLHYSGEVKEYGDVEAAFARADHVIEARIHQHRHQNVPMETRGVVAEWHPDGTLDVWSGNQGVHSVVKLLAVRLGLAPEQVRVRNQDTGGSFGLKIGGQREDVAVAVAARELGRPVKWIEDRTEHLAASGHAREEQADVAIAFTEDGELLGLTVELLIDGGAYPGIASMIHRLIEGLVPGPYKIGALRFSARSAITNKATYVAYRGPWAFETFIRERMIDLVARHLGREPLEIRNRNVVTEADQPASLITGMSLAGITVDRANAEIAGQIDVPAFRARQAAAREQGRYLGLGVASFIEAAPGPRGRPPGTERMLMELADDGKLIVTIAQQPHGQSHETTTAQVAAEEFGVHLEDVVVVYGDSRIVPVGRTGGSRSATLTGGAALHSARQLRAHVLDAAAEQLEAAVEDLDIVHGAVAVRGVPARALPLADLAVRARHAAGIDAPAFTVDFTYDGGAGGWSGGTHAAIVDVDLGTGLVKIERYVAVQDCGRLINPAIVDGQVRGGVAQGIGAVLLERSAYDDQGQFLAATFVDYLMPSATEIPRIEVHHLETIPLDGDVNFRGAGEGGMIVAPATLVNAIEDALSPFGARITEQHLPPTRILELAGVLPVS